MQKGISIMDPVLDAIKSVEALRQRINKLDEKNTEFIVS